MLKEATPSDYLIYHPLMKQHCPFLALQAAAEYYPQRVWGAVLFILCGLAFLLLAHSVFVTHSFALDDVVRETFAQNPPLPWIAASLEVATRTADRETIVWGGIGVILLSLAFRRSFIWHALYFAAATAISFLLNNSLKLYYARPRPPGADIVYFGVSNSFPSGHAFIVVCFYGLLTYLLAQYVFPRHKAWLYTGSVVLMLLVGLSRLTLGVHYLSDVLAGYLLALLCLGVSIPLHHLLLGRREQPGPTP